VFTTFNVVHTVQNSDDSISAIVIPQSANHHSVTKGQVNMLQAHNCTVDSNICATVSSCDSNIQQRASTIIVLPNGYQFYNLHLCCI